MMGSMLRRANISGGIVDPTPGYNESFDGGTSSTTVYPYLVDGQNATSTSYSSVINGGQATNP